MSTIAEASLGKELQFSWEEEIKSESAGASRGFFWLRSVVMWVSLSLFLELVIKI